MIFTMSRKAIHLLKKQILRAYQVLTCRGKAENKMVTWKHSFPIPWVLISCGK